MSITWILVANASAAHLYANYGPKKGLHKLKEFEHNASRGKAQDLVSDRPGHYNGHGSGHGSFIPATIRNKTKPSTLLFSLPKNLIMDALPIVISV